LIAKNKNLNKKTYVESCLSNNQIIKKTNEFETPIVPQLKKMKINENTKGITTQKEELKKIFGFELKEIKKSNSNRPSTEKPSEENQNPLLSKLPLGNGNSNINYSNNVKLLLQQQQNKLQNKNQYWGRGYNLNYPNYA